MSEWKTDLLPTFSDREKAAIKASQKKGQRRFEKRNKQSSNPDLNGIPREMGSWLPNLRQYQKPFSFGISVNFGYAGDQEVRGEDFLCSSYSTPSGYNLLRNTLASDTGRWYAGIEDDNDHKE